LCFYGAGTLGKCKNISIFSKNKSYPETAKRLTFSFWDDTLTEFK